MRPNPKAVGARPGACRPLGRVCRAAFGRPFPSPPPPVRPFQFWVCGSTRAAARFARFSCRRSDPIRSGRLVAGCFFPSFLLSFSSRLLLRSLPFPLAFAFALAFAFVFLFSPVDCSSCPDRLLLFCSTLAPGLRGSVGSRVRARRCRMEGRGAPAFRRLLEDVRSRLPKFWLAFGGGLPTRLSPPAPPLV